MNQPAPLITAEVEQARKTGGMLALLPSEEDAARYAVPGGDPIEELHVTLIYFGEDVTDLRPDAAQRAADEIVEDYPALEAQIFGVATFNPDHPEREMCQVYLIGDSRELNPLRHDLMVRVDYKYPLPNQHEPNIFHMTGGYGIPALTKTGPIVFDRLLLSWAGERYVWPLHP